MQCLANKYPQGLTNVVAAFAMKSIRNVVTKGKSKLEVDKVTFPHAETVGNGVFATTDLQQGEIFYEVILTGKCLHAPLACSPYMLPLHAPLACSPYMLALHAPVACSPCMLPLHAPVACSPCMLPLHAETNGLSRVSEVAHVRFVNPPRRKKKRIRQNCAKVNLNAKAEGSAVPIRDPNQRTTTHPQKKQHVLP